MEKLLTVDQVAEVLQIHPQVIRLWLREGRLPGIKIGKEWRVDPKDLAKFLEEGKQRQE